MTSGASHATVSLRPPRMGALSNRFEVSATSRFTNSAVVSLVLISQQLPFFIHIFVDICEASASQVFTASTNKTVSYFRMAKKSGKYPGEHEEDVHGGPQALLRRTALQCRGKCWFGHGGFRVPREIQSFTACHRQPHR